MWLTTNIKDENLFSLCCAAYEKNVLQFLVVRIEFFSCCFFGVFQILEACMNNCGKRFHSEAAKFRFLNELIKVLTPKVLLIRHKNVSGSF